MHQLVWWVFEALIMLVFASTILSWFRLDTRNGLVKFVNGIVDPLLHPIRAILPTPAGLDFSPMVAILILWSLQKLLTGGIAH